MTRDSLPVGRYQYGMTPARLRRPPRWRRTSPAALRLHRLAGEVLAILDTTPLHAPERRYLDVAARAVTRAAAAAARADDR
jgi:hypothetical protein